MTVEMIALRSHDEWLERRGKTIGGSDASAIVGLNPYKTNVELWMEKTGRVQHEDIGDKPYVQYGTHAERHLRELFKLDFPQLRVEYVENNLWVNSRYPWAHYSADGWLYDDRGRLGILEIKTTNILQSMQKEKWNDRIPDNYYIQILHGFIVMDAEFAILKAQLKTEFCGMPYMTTRHYPIERAEVEQDIQILADYEREFAECMRSDRQPALQLPEI